MCDSHAHISIYSGGEKSFQYDPTRTSTLRKVFVREANKRFNTLNASIKKALIDKDVFGIDIQTNAVNKNAFAALPDGDKIDAFVTWLRLEVENNVLQKYRSGYRETAWFNPYVDSIYRTGILRGRAELRKAGYDVPVISSIEQELALKYNKDRLNLLYSTFYNDLQTITDDLASHISKILGDSFIRKESNKVIAKKISDVITGTSNKKLTKLLGKYVGIKNRAEILVRTEVTRIHHLATIQEYRNAEVESVAVLGEFATMKDDKVCSICAGFDGTILTLDEAEALIPIHPLCRCMVLPVRFTRRT